MATLSRFFLAAAQNGVPLGGWFLGGWSPATALAVYWIENVVLGLAVAVRIRAHQLATHTRGHERGFLSGFLVATLAFTAVHGIFLAALLVLLHLGPVDWTEVRDGARWVVASHLASLVLDSFTLRHWPFAELRRRTEWTLGRVGLVHFSLLVGMFLAATRDRPDTIFSVFVVLKAVSEIGSLVPQWKPREAPAPLVRLMNRIPAKRGQESFEDYWRRTTREEEAKHARDEEVVERA